MKPRRWLILLVPMVLLFVLGVACGDDEPTAAPVAGLSAEGVAAAVQAAVAAIPRAEGVSAEEVDKAVADAVKQALAGIPPTATPAPAPTPFVATEEKRKLNVALNSFNNEEIAPHLSGTLTGIALVANYSDHLMGLTVDNQFTNQWGLSKSWEQIDGNTYEFTIKQGIKFHDGDDFTVEDAKGSIELLATEEAVGSNCLYCGTWAQVLDTIEILGPDKMRINLTRDEPFLYDIIAPKAAADSYIGSKRKWDEVGANSQDWEAAGAPGTGPWDFIDRSIGTSTTFEKWADYYSPAFRSKFDEMQIILTIEDAARVAQVSTGEVDLAVSSGAFVGEIRGAGLNVVGPKQVDSLYLNFYESHDPGHCTNKLEVRKALNLAVDVDALVGALYAPGTYSRSASPFFTPYDEGWRTDLPPYGYDPDEAMRLLEGAGCAGMKMTVYAFSFGVAPEMIDAQDAAVTYYRAVGVDATLVPIDWTAVRPLVQQGGLSADKVDNPSGVHVIPAARNFGEKIRSHGLWPDVGGSVNGLWSDKYVATRLQYATDTNPTTRKALAQRLAKEMYDEYVNIPIAFRDLIYAANPETVCGWEPLNGTQVALMFNTVEPCK